MVIEWQVSYAESLFYFAFELSRAMVLRQGLKKFAVALIDGVPHEYLGTYLSKNDFGFVCRSASSRQADAWLVH